MKTLKSPILFAAFLLGFTSQLAISAPWATIQKSKKIRLATEGAFAPFNIFKGKELTGFEVDLAADIAKKLSLTYDWQTKPFDNLLIGLSQDRYDLVAASHGVTPERAKAVDFTDPHYCTGGVIVSKEKGPKTVGDLKGKSVAVQVGSTYLQNVQKVAGVKDVKTYPRDTDSLQNLLAGRVDSWVTDKFVALDAVKANPQLRIGAMLFQERVAMAVAKGNTSLRDKVNSALAALKKDGTYAKLSQKYFGQDISCK